MCSIQQHLPKVIQLSLCKQSVVDPILLLAKIWFTITPQQWKLLELIRGIISSDFYCCCIANQAIKKTVNAGFILCRVIPHAWKINEEFLVHCLLKTPLFYSILIVNLLFDILTNGSCWINKSDILTLNPR